MQRYTLVTRKVQISTPVSESVGPDVICVVNHSQHTVAATPDTLL